MTLEDIALALLGGALVGTAFGIPLLVHGHGDGVSGMVAGLRQGAPRARRHRAAFLAGLVVTGLVAHLAGAAAPLAEVRPAPAHLVGGLLVGLGARLANGCTSGHGILGVTRGARRSLVAVALFAGAAAATVALYPVGG